MAEWRNWAGTVVAHPDEVVRARDVAHVQSVVRSAHDAGLRVKAVGAGHSFTAIAEPVDVQLRLDALTGVHSVDEATGRVWVGAGTTVRALGAQLWQRGLALPNQGDIDAQSVAGALATGTHGTGAGFPGMAAAVTGLVLVLADGSLLRIDGRHQPDLVPAAAVGLGALGIVTAVELACVPRFLLAADEGPVGLSELLDGLDERVESADHFEFFWFPHTDRALRLTKTRVHDPARRAPLPRWRARLEDELLANGALEGMCRVAARAPRLTPAINAVSGRALSARSFTDWSHLVFANSRRVRFRESEWSVPRAAVADLVRELAAYTRRKEQPVPFPVEVRFGAADDRWLATAYGRDSGYVAVHQYHRMAHEEFFGAFWAMLRDLDARPHWGKMHDLDAPRLRARYPRFEAFLALRDQLDPDRVFANPHLDRILGP